MTIRRSVMVLLLLLVPQGARASDSLATTSPTMFRVVLDDDDTLHAVSVEPAPFDMVTITLGNATVRHLPSARIRRILDADSMDRTAWVLERRETLDASQAQGAKRPVKRRVSVGPRAVTPAFLISETSMLLRVSESAEGGDDRRFVLSFDVGLIWNVSERSAIGVTPFFGSGAAGTRHSFVNSGFRARYRRWLSPTSNVEVAPAIILGEDRAGEAHPPGYSMQATFSPNLYLSLTAEVFSLHRMERRYSISANRETEVDLHELDLLLGVKVGRLPGLLGGAVAGVVALVSAFGAGEVSSLVEVP